MTTAPISIVQIFILSCFLKYMLSPIKIIVNIIAGDFVAESKLIRPMVLL